MPEQIKALDWQHARERLSRAAAALESAQALTKERAQAILDERARAAARVPDEGLAPSATVELVRFVLGAERYAIETNCVREVLRLKDLTRVPGTPDFVVGVTNLRGQIVAVFDLRRFFSIPAPASTEAARIIVMGQERIEFGILADAVEEVALLRLSTMQEPPASVAGIAKEYVRGVTAEPLIVLDGKVLLHDPRLYIDVGDDFAARTSEVTP